jgi:hypothetical protein
VGGPHAWARRGHACPTEGNTHNHLGSMCSHYHSRVKVPDGVEGLGSGFRVVPTTGNGDAQGPPWTSTIPAADIRKTCKCQWAAPFPPPGSICWAATRTCALNQCKARMAARGRSWPALVVAATSVSSNCRGYFISASCSATRNLGCFFQKSGGAAITMVTARHPSDNRVQRLYSHLASRQHLW